MKYVTKQSNETPKDKCALLKSSFNTWNDADINSRHDIIDQKAATKICAETYDISIRNTVEEGLKNPNSAIITSIREHHED